LRQAEVERVKRKRPDGLDAYDLVLQAQPDISSGMPERATKALALLDRALALDSTYALAHGFAAMCHHNRFLRAGLREEDRAASIRHAQAAILCGQDDALALTFAGFSIGMDAHDRAAAFAAFEAALAVSPSTASRSVSDIAKLRRLKSHNEVKRCYFPTDKMLVNFLRYAAGVRPVLRLNSRRKKVGSS
jgi:hypothetical protein